MRSVPSGTPPASWATQCKLNCSWPRAPVAPSSQRVTGLYRSPDQTSQPAAAHLDGLPPVKSHSISPAHSKLRRACLEAGDRGSCCRGGALWSFGHSPRAQEGAPSQVSSSPWPLAPGRVRCPHVCAARVPAPALHGVQTALRPWAGQGGGRHFLS